VLRAPVLRVGVPAIVPPLLDRDHRKYADQPATVPLGADGTESGDGSSPVEPPAQGRGLRRIHDEVVLDGATPARAGPTCMYPPSRNGYRSNPRVGGADNVKKQDPGKEEQPPCGRGRLARPERPVLDQRATPEPAGPTMATGPRPAATMRNPRVGGADRMGKLLLVTGGEQPPRGRGRRSTERDTVSNTRATPAWAGSTTRGSAGWPVPRATPAWAGSTTSRGCTRPATTSNPRVGGVDLDDGLVRARVGEQPPRGRGRLPAADDRAVVVGATPAWAGSTLADVG
jgi:hypothetical protein